jgi:hypothetical protein
MSEQIKQSQKLGDQSLAVSAGGNVSIVVGVTATEVIEIATSLWNANFPALQHEAKHVARERMDDFVNRFVTSLERNYKEGMAQASDVGFQAALFRAQGDFARSGDDKLGDVLVDLLVERTKVPDRGLLQIVLDQSLETVHKLTKNQLDALGIIFLLRHTADSEIRSKEMLAEHFDSYLRPLAEDFSLTRASLQHMEFAGCGTIGVASATIQGLMLHTYPGLFNKGVFEVAIDRDQFSSDYNSLVVQCLNDPNRLQVGVISDESLEREIAAKQISADEGVHLRQLWTANVMNEHEVADLLIKMQPYMRQIIPMWTSTEMCKFPLTSVGIALGHATLRQRGLEMGPLSTWIS